MFRASRTPPERLHRSHRPAGGRPASLQRLVARSGLNAIARLKDEEINGAYRRYDAFFRSTGGALGGTWAWEDVDCAYVLVDMERFGDAGPQTVNYLLPTSSSSSPAARTTARR